MRKKEKDEPADSDNENEDGDAAWNGEDGGCTDEQKLLADFRHKLEQDLRQGSRNLLVRDFVLQFSPQSIYGARSGFLKALLITAPCLLLTVG